MPAGMTLVREAASSSSTLTLPEPVVEGDVERLGVGGGAGRLHVAQHERVLFLSSTQEEKSTITDWLLVVAVMKASSPAMKGVRQHVARAEVGAGVHHAGVAGDGRAQGGVVGRAGLDAADLHGLGGGRVPAEDGLDEAGHAGPGGIGRGGHHEHAVGLVTPDDRLPGPQGDRPAGAVGEAPGQLAEGDRDLRVGGLLARAAWGRRSSRCP